MRTTTTPSALAAAGHRALVGILVLLLLFTLHAARDLLVPLVLGLFLYLILSPVVRALAVLRLPEPAAAALVAGVVLAGLGGAVYGLATPAGEWVSRAPQAVADARFRLQALARPLEEVTRATEEVEAMADGGGGSERVVVRDGSLGAQVALHTGKTLLGVAITAILTLYLLAFGRHCGRAAVRLAPGFAERRRLLRIGEQVRVEVSRYLLTYTCINIGLGAAVALSLYLLGVPNPILFGVVAGVLNYVPFLGPAITMGLLFFVSLLTFPLPAQAVVPPLVVFALNVVESQLVTPNVMAQRLTLNPLLVLVALLIWGWLWGIAGALLAVPLLVAFKIICDHVPRLEPVGAFIGSRGGAERAAGVQPTG